MKLSASMLGCDMSTGWLKLHRSLLDNDLWSAEPFTYGQAWVDLLLSANYADRSVWIRGIEVPVKRGQLAWSELTMSKRWKWSRGKVRRYLVMLETRGMVVQQKSKLTTILTICNYSTYQQEEQQGEQQGEQQTEQQAEQQTDNRRYTREEGKKGKKGKKDTLSPQAGAPPAPKNPELDYSCWPAMPDEQTLTDWHAMRKRIKADVSQTVINSFGKELHAATATGFTVDQCLAECVTRNWRGFKSEWMQNANRRNSHAASRSNNQPNRGLDPNDTSWIDPLFDDPSYGLGSPVGSQCGEPGNSPIEGDFSSVDGRTEDAGAGSGSAAPVVARFAGGRN